MDEEAIKEGVERLEHVPYYFAQIAMGIDDGGFASLYDSQSGGDFDGRFSNEIGGDIMAYVFGCSGKREFSKNLPKLFDMEAMSHFTYRMPDEPAMRISWRRPTRSQTRRSPMSSPCFRR